MKDLVLSGDVYRALRDKGLVTEDPKDVCRCTIVLEGEEPARIVIEKFGDEALRSLSEVLSDQDAEDEQSSPQNEGGQ